MKLLRLYFEHAPAMLVWAVIAGGVSGLAAVWLLGLVTAILAAGTWQWAMLWAFAALCVLRLGSGVVSHLLLIRLSQSALREMRLSLCDRILRAPLRTLEETGPARLAACFGDDIVNLSNIVVNVPYFLMNVIVIAGCMAYLAWLSWPIMLGLSGCLAAGMATYLLPVMWATRHLRRAREAQDELFTHFRCVTDGAKELKLHAGRRGQFVRELLRAAAEAVERHNVRGVGIYATAANWNRLLFFVYVGLVLFALPAVREVTAAEQAAYVLVLLYLMAPLEAVVNTLPHLSRASISLERFHGLTAALAAAAREEHAEHAHPCPQPPVIALQRVTHEYRNTAGDRGFALGPVDMTIRPNEVIYLIGGNGDGKTTLVKLLTGLYAPTAGVITWDGGVVSDENRDAYRQLFSAVFSDFHLFDRLLGIPAERLISRAPQLLALLRLDHALSISGDRFSTTALSQGQRKRLALLAALLEDRPIYIFDEWAADQDPLFREIFYRRIVPELKRVGKTVIVVTHDERYFDLADRVLRLECGRIVAADAAAGIASLTG